MLDLANLQAALPELAHGLYMTVMLSGCAMVLSWLFGTALVVCLLSPAALPRRAAAILVSFLRGTPALVQLFLVFFTLPLAGIKVPPFTAAAVTLGLNSGAYVAEILRGGLGSLPSGQAEAAEALGFPRWRIWTRVLLPQAVRVSLPSLVNELTLLVKTTPLASVVAVTELTFAGQIVVARTFEPTEVLLAVALAYILLNLALTDLAARLDRRLAPAGGRS
ncbi:amino acid ABC transporter permease [Palleronia sp. LCG004]|uniref:amino acid ABC transporter permease n=1 Tax=Palleronia sp. LCG004 TaxID=3079304 RepID=UPI002943AE51|nr:amino acid ABC transporter permease [Palleronia sp. LCG004]WOI57895.1 amino acid ABC transporter permease [Palleronia sp. LCG004]